MIKLNNNNIPMTRLSFLLNNNAIKHNTNDKKTKLRTNL